MVFLFRLQQVLRNLVEYPLVLSGFRVPGGVRVEREHRVGERASQACGGGGDFFCCCGLKRGAWLSWSEFSLLWSFRVSWIWVVVGV